jgi:hypothetical protein
MSDAQRLNKLEEAIATGATEITMNGRKIVFRSLAEMRSIRDELRRQTDTNKGPDVLRPTFSKGYE